jgi:hypothetical protein
MSVALAPKQMMAHFKCVVNLKIAIRRESSLIKSLWTEFVYFASDWRLLSYISYENLLQGLIYLMLMDICGLIGDIPLSTGTIGPKNIVMTFLPVFNP